MSLDILIPHLQSILVRPSKAESEPSAPCHHPSRTSFLNNPKLTNPGITNKLRPSALPPNQRWRDNRLHTDWIHPLNRRRCIRRPRLPLRIPASARQPNLRRGTWAPGLGSARRKLDPACDQDGWKACSARFVGAGYLWAFCFWGCV